VNRNLFTFAASAAGKNFPFDYFCFSLKTFFVETFSQITFGCAHGAFNISLAGPQALTSGASKRQLKSCPFQPTPTRSKQTTVNK
jgi:hypothetical protein